MNLWKREKAKYEEMMSVLAQSANLADEPAVKGAVRHALQLCIIYHFSGLCVDGF